MDDYTSAVDKIFLVKIKAFMPAEVAGIPYTGADYSFFAIVKWCQLLSFSNEIQTIVCVG